MTESVQHAELVAPFEPLSGDDLERIEVVGAEGFEIIPLAQTAQFHRQQAMDLRDQVEQLQAALKEAAGALDSAGFTFSADKARAALLLIDGVDGRG